MKKPLLLVIVGPTSSGKSDLAVKLARRFNGELVSADSRQVYIGMDIGTAKLKPPRGVKQWLVDVVRPDQSFTLKQYQRLALRVIGDIQRRGKLPILIGGTGLYIDAVVDNWQIPAVAPQHRLRRKLERVLLSQGLSPLVRQLQTVDILSAERIDLNNPRRVIRALEVAFTTGNSFVSAKQKGEPRFNVLKICLIASREQLRQRIQKRTQAMVRRGLVGETRRLLKRYSPHLPAMSGIGYAEVAAYINGEIQRAEMINKIVTHSMQYARRQMTWWKRDSFILHVTNSIAATTVIRRWLLVNERH